MNKNCMKIHRQNRRATPVYSEEICRNNLQGRCKWGKRCWYVHKDVQTTVGEKHHNAPNINNRGRQCEFYKRGWCKYGERCRDYHTGPWVESRQRQMQHRNSGHIPYNVGHGSQNMTNKWINKNSTHQMGFIPENVERSINPNGEESENALRRNRNFLQLQMENEFLWSKIIEDQNGKKQV